MSLTPGTGGHRPRVPGEPGEVFICRPVLCNVRFPERNHLKPVSVGVFKQLDVNPPTPDRRVVAAGECQPAGDEVDVRTDRQLMSASPAQYQGGGGGAAGAPLLRGGSARLTGLKQQYKGNILHH